MSYLLTVDVDWAQQEDIALTLKVLRSQGIRSTWMLTHPPTDELLAAEEAGEVEFGIHPNFLPGSTHGDSLEEVLSHVTTFAPNARVMRSHSLYQSGRLWPEVLSRTDVALDSSLFLPGLTSPQRFELDFAEGRLVRVPFVWADDYILTGHREPVPPPLSDKAALPWVLMVHPVHVAAAARSESFGLPPHAEKRKSAPLRIGQSTGAYAEIMRALELAGSYPCELGFISGMIASDTSTNG